MEELIKKAQNGDEESFTKLILYIKNDLYKIAKTRITEEEDIQDAIQETMIETYNSIRKLKDIKKFKLWTIKILINKCNHIYKKKYKKDVYITDYDLDKSLSFSSYNNVEDNLNFYSLIKNLDYDERLIIVLYYMEKYTLKEISKIIKLKENTVKSKFYRARIKIKENYEGGLKNGSLR